MALKKDSLVPLKRVDLIADDHALDELKEICRTVGIRGYTYIKQAGGLGSRGERRPDAMGLEEKNVVLILACTEEHLEKLVEALTPRMKDLGCMCLVTDCNWVKGAEISY